MRERGLEVVLKIAFPLEQTDYHVGRFEEVEWELLGPYINKLMEGMSLDSRRAFCAASIQAERWLGLDREWWEYCGMPEYEEDSHEEDVSAEPYSVESEVSAESGSESESSES